MSNSFIAFDFETANNFRASACEIGLVKVINGEIADTFQSLIKPPSGFSEFSPFNVRIHGITELDVKKAPTFDSVWYQAEEFSEGLPFVAHNASFDAGVVSATAKASGLEDPFFEYYCTLLLSRRVLQLDSYKLSKVAKSLGIEFTGHHKAVNDAGACAEIAIALTKLKSAEDLPSLAKLVKLKPKINGESTSGSLNVNAKTIRTQSSEIYFAEVSNPPTNSNSASALNAFSSTNEKSPIRAPGSRAKTWGMVLSILAAPISVLSIIFSFPVLLPATIMNIVAYRASSENQKTAKKGLWINLFSWFVSISILIAAEISANK
jgi:DNA polymerase-3 subunit epsilon